MDALIYLAMHIVDVLFFVGLVGAAIVVVLSFIEDCSEILGDE